MLPNPLHPAVVHLPIAICLLLPLFTAGAYVYVALGSRRRHAWAAVMVVHSLLVISAWAALQTGEDEEELVERVVGESYVELHEEMAEDFLYVAVIGLGVSALGLVTGRRGSIGRILYSVTTVALVAMAIRVEASGGELVYKHGAASAYTGAAGASAERSNGGVGRPHEGDRHEEDDDDDSDD